MTLPQRQDLRRAQDSAFLRQRFVAELVIVIVAGVVVGFLTGPIFLEWAGVSLEATFDEEPVPGTWGNTLLIGMGLFGTIIWPGLFCIPFFFYARRRQKRADAKRWSVENELRDRRRAETQARIEQAQADGLLDKWRETE